MRRAVDVRLRVWLCTHSENQAAVKFLHTGCVVVLCRGVFHHKAVSACDAG